MAALLNSLFFVFNISFLPLKYRVNSIQLIHFESEKIKKTNMMIIL